MNLRHRPLLWLSLIVLMVVAIQLALPVVLLHYLNRQMAEMGDYRGHVETLTLAWWRGATRLEGIRIEKEGARVQVPLFEAKAFDTSLSWRALWKNRAIVARLTLHEPHVNFVDGGKTGASQDGEGVDWRERLEDLLNITIEEAHVVNGQVSFRNFTSDPPVHVYANAIQASLYNLTNTRDASGQRVAEFDMTAKLFNQAPLEARARFDPFTHWEDFSLQARTTGLVLTQLNDFSKAYGRFDFAKGTGDVVLEVEAKDSRLTGYIKPLLHNVDVFDLRQDVQSDDQGLLQSLWEAVVGGGQEVLQNQSKDQFATRIELSGSLKDAEISPFQTFLGILRNAFVQAFTPRFEESLKQE